jgi:hypothetical protein
MNGSGAYDKRALREAQGRAAPQDRHTARVYRYREPLGNLGRLHPDRALQDGTFQVFVGDKYDPKTLVATGNVSEEAEVYAR